MSNRYAILLEEEKTPLRKAPEHEDVRKPASPQRQKTANPQADKAASGLDRKSANPHADRSVKEPRERYSTRLLPATIKAIRMYAIEHDLNDYEVVEQGFKLLQARDTSKSPQTR